LTHSLHRKGTVENLKSDYVILAMLAAGINDKLPGSRKKLLRIAEIMKRHNPTNILTEKAWRISSIVQATFTDIKTVRNIIEILKQEELGVSIVISGLISDIETLVKEANLKMHTIHLSLGTFGRVELLPSSEILEITSMCGHHCISAQSVEHYLDLIKKGKLSTQNAAEKLAKPCICGIFNISRAKNLLKELRNKDL